MKKLIVLDYTTGIAHCYTYDSTRYSQDEDIEQLIETFGHNSSNCYYMTTTEEIVIH